MKVIRTFVPKSFANYNHLVICTDTTEAAAVDPFNAEHLMKLAQTQGVKITQIWVTHEHGDHIRDVDKLKALTGARVLAPKPCKGFVNADHWLEHDESINIGSGEVKHWLTPGHIQGHGVFFTTANGSDAPFVIAGDTLFNAGVGNVKSGNVAELHDSVRKLVNKLTDETELYTGHDYLVTNLKFVLHHFPSCASALKALQKTQDQTPDTRSVMTMAKEKTYNPFFALEQPWVTNHPELTNLSPKDRFIALRNLRDQW
jgi:hydroxyacylglutathione hydrolase